MIDKQEPYKREVSDQIISDICIYAKTTFERAINNLLDGLKTVQRRVLFTYWEKKETSIKVVKLTGLTLAYHPHGDTALNEAIIGMARDVTVNYPLFKGEGSFGNISSFTAASPRYIAVKISEFGKSVMLDTIDTNTLDMINGEDLDTKEPAYLPSKIPLVLLNGSYGIAELTVVDIPQHNLNEIADRCIAYIKNPDITNNALAKGLYPDYVSGGVIVNGNELNDMYDGVTKVSIRLRGEVELDKENDRIIIKSLPHNVDQTTVIEQIRQLVYGGNDKSSETKNVALSNVSFVGDVVDKKTGTASIVIECKHGTNLVEIENYLYKNTSVERINGVKFTLNEHGRVRTYNLKEIIAAWYKVNRNIRCRKITLSINRLEQRIHVLEGIVQVYSKLDEIIDLIKKFNGTKEELTQILSKTYSLSLIQARSICEMHVGDLSRRSEADLKKSIADNKEKVRILSNELKRADELMINDLIDLKEKFGRPRRTKIVQELDTSGVHSISNGVILYTRNAYSLFHMDNILNKRTYLDFKAVKIDDKWCKELIGFHPVTSDIKSVLVFYTDKTVSPVPVSLINKWFNDSNCEKRGFIKAICPLYENESGTVVCVTSEGMIKRFDPKEIKSKSVNIGTVIETCIFVPTSQEDQKLLMINESGEYRYYPLSEIRETGRSSQGVMSGFNESNLRLAISDKDSTHVVVTVEGSLGDGMCYSVDLESINTTTRTTKLRRIVDIDGCKFSGVGFVNLNIKEQLIVFYTKGLITSSSGRVLKNMKDLRKLGANKAFGIMSIEL